MKLKRSWLSLVLIAAMLLAMAPAVQAAGEEEGEEGDGFRNLAPESAYTWSEEPEAAYPDPGGKLTDGIWGAGMNDGNWVGHRYKKTREVVFDLGEPKTIKEVSANFLQDWPVGRALLPLTVSFYVSDDLTNWEVLSHNAIQTLWIDTIKTETYKWDGSPEPLPIPGNDNTFERVPRTDYKEGMVYAQYVKVVFSMHPSAYSMIDEVQIIGADGRLEEAQTVEPSPFGLLPPGEASGGIENMGLIYNGHYPNNKGNWSKERLIPNISYVDKNGEPKDWMFDGVLYLGLNAPNGNGFGAPPAPDMKATKADWEWYLNKTFAVGGDMDALNAATVEVGEKIDDPGHKTKVVIMIPEPGSDQSNFGSVNGENLDFNIATVGKKTSLENRAKAIQWWVDEVSAAFAAKQYSNLELVGMYWLEEQIDTGSTGPKMLQLTSEIVHDTHDMKLFWIPHYLAYKGFMWKDVGIDAVSLQPNYFFEPLDISRLEDTANMAKRYGMSLEVEFDDRMITDGVFRKRFIEYLNSGVETGLMNSGFKAFYQGNNAVYDAAISADPATRILYDWLYKFTKGEYEPQSMAAPDVDVFLNGEPFQSGTKVPDQTKAKFTWKLKEEFEEGLVKVTAKFDGAVYNEGDEIDLTNKPGKHLLEVTVAATESKVTGFAIEAEFGAARMLESLEQYIENNQLKNAKANRAMRNALEMMKRVEAADGEQALEYLKQFNAKLDEARQTDEATDGAYNFLKEAVFYNVGSLAQDKPATASTVEAAHLTPDKAFDGVAKSRWASEVLPTAWLQVDLGESKTFDTIKVDWEFARAQEYQLLYSNDLASWTAISVNGNNKLSANQGIIVMNVEPVTARYVKMDGIRRATDYGYSIYELGLYNLAYSSNGKVIDGLQAAVSAASKEVTIDGLIMNGEKETVYVKVLDPNGDIQYSGQTQTTDSGSFQVLFTLNGNVEGVYTAELETDAMTAPEKVTFEYKQPASPGNGNGNGEVWVPAPDLFVAQADGSVKAIPSLTLGSNGAEASASVSASDLNTAIAKAAADSKGKKHVAIELKKTGQATVYALELPLSYWKDQPNVVMHLATPYGQLEWSGALLANVEASGQKLRLVIGDETGTGNSVAAIGSRPAIRVELQMDGKALAWNHANAHIQAAIPYELGSKEKADKLSAYELGAKHSANKLEGASYDAASRMLRFAIAHNGVYAAGYPQPATFTDLGSYEWAREAIEELAERGIVKGTSLEHGTFSPGKQVTRADFVLMLVNSLGLEAELASTFADVSQADYFYEAVSIAKQLGIVSGVDGVNFAPRANITRQDMMVMLTRALQSIGAIDSAGDPSGLNAFHDAGQVAVYAQGSVAKMIEHGLVTGAGGYLLPLNQASRAEAAVFMYRIIKFAE